MNEDKFESLEKMAEDLPQGRPETSIDISKVLVHAKITEEELSDAIYHYSDSDRKDQKYTFEKDFQVSGQPENYHMLIKTKS